MNIVVTSGGVREKIDSVRSITNSSSGTLGYKIATEFFKMIPDCTVFYLHSATVKPYENEILGPRIRNIEITDTNCLLESVKDILTTNKIDIFIHSMAVADYTTDCVVDLHKFVFNLCSGGIENLNFDNVMNLLRDNSIEANSKISSAIENPMILLTQTPKVISEIKKLSPYTFLVGFKLLDSVSEEDLFDVGFDLLRKNRCNLVLANDISKIRQGNHRGLLIYPEKSYDVLEGKDNIAKKLVQIVLDRFYVRHPHSEQQSKDNNISDGLYQEFYNMGRWLDNGDYLPKVINHERIDKVGTYGNLSCRKPKSSNFYITCRNVNKGDLKKSDISSIEKVNRKAFSKDNRVYSDVFYNSELKPSIDTAIHSEIFKHTDYTHIVHIHTNRVFLGIPYIADMFPCGSENECDAILKAVLSNNTNIVQMKKHGLLVMGYSFEGCKNILNQLFMETPYIDYSTNIISNECEKHIEEIQADFIKTNCLFPMGLNNEDIGCLYEEHNSRMEVDFGIFTMANIRGKGLHIVEKYLKMYDKNYFLHTTEKCKIMDFYKNKYDFLIFSDSNKNNIVLLKRRKNGTVLSGEVEQHKKEVSKLLGLENR